MFLHYINLNLQRIRRFIRFIGCTNETDTKCVFRHFKCCILGLEALAFSKAIMGLGEMGQVPPHLALGCISREFLEIVSTQTKILKIDATDIMIMSCIAYLSTKDALLDPKSIEEYEYGNNPLPLAYCEGIYTKEVSYFLNITYETVRRRLEVLVERGFILKKGRKYYLPYQFGDDDYTQGARLMAVNCINRLVAIADNFK